MSTISFFLLTFFACKRTNNVGKYVLLQEIIQHSPPKQSNGQQSETPAAHEQSFGDLWLLNGPQLGDLL